MTALPRQFNSFTAARAGLRSVLDAAAAGLVTTVLRDGQRFVVTAAPVLRTQLAELLPARAVVVAEGGGWSAYLPGAPVHGDAATFDEAIDDLVESLREYADDWNDRLQAAPNHRQHRSLVELVELSDDDELRSWLLNGADVLDQDPPHLDRPETTTKPVEAVQPVRGAESVAT